MEKKTQKKLLWPLVIAALMFGAMIALGRKIHFAGNVHLSYTMNTFDDFVWTDLVVFALAAVGTFVLLLVLDALYDRIARPADNKAFNKKLFIICFVVLVLAAVFPKRFPGNRCGRFVSFRQSGTRRQANRQPFFGVLHAVCGDFFANRRGVRQHHARRILVFADAVSCYGGRVRTVFDMAGQQGRQALVSCFGAGILCHSTVVCDVCGHYVERSAVYGVFAVSHDDAV